MLKLSDSIKLLEGVRKQTERLNKKILRDCIVLLRMFEATDKKFDGYLDTVGTLSGGMKVQWVLDWRGNIPTESVTLTYHAPGEIKIQSTSVSKKALQIINTVGLFFHLKEEAAKKAELEKKEGRPSSEKDEENKGGVSKLYGNAPLYFT